MNELIKINYDSEQPTVSGRELHEFFQVGTEYKKWFERMSEYGFSENTDFARVTQKCPTLGGMQNMTDHQLTVPMAKEICMLQRNEKGKQARQYFIQLENAWNTPEQVMARALKFADKQMHALQIENSELTYQNQLMYPKALFADAVAASKTSILVGELAKLLRQNGVDIGEKRLFDYLRDNGYLIKRIGTDRNMPTQRSVDAGWFTIKETTVNHADGHISISKTPKVTGKGQSYFINLFLSGKAKF
mgnify:CR=1 FL=1